MITDKQNEKGVPSTSRQLYPLNEVKDFNMRDDRPDVRGWEVRDRDNNKFGTVTELIVEPERKKVRYLDVEPSGDQANKGRMLIPVGIAKLNKDEKAVILNDLNKDLLASYPLYNGSFDRNYEISILEKLPRYGGEATPMGTEGFYSTPLHDDERFYYNKDKSLR